jgi:hypothetical protein
MSVRTSATVFVRSVSYRASTLIPVSFSKSSRTGREFSSSRET